ncbi:MAG: signal peptidase I [Clostridia bacterium]|nr:signal peptidase I [Clostridia bacterium]
MDNQNLSPSLEAETQTSNNKDKNEEKQTIVARLYDWLEIFAVSVAVVFIIFAFVARVAIVDGNSMNDTLKDGDKLLVSELFYTPKQGDIIVCQAEYFGPEEPLVKRIVATEGQTIRIDTENWQVFVNDIELEEDYVKHIIGRDMHGWSYGEEYTVPKGHVFVMGDNRNNSADSRDSRVGPIDERYIIGKVIFRFSPKFGFVK